MVIASFSGSPTLLRLFRHHSAPLPHGADGIAYSLFGQCGDLNLGLRVDDGSGLCGNTQNQRAVSCVSSQAGGEVRRSGTRTT